MKTSCYLGLIIASNITVIIGTVFVFIAFFTNNWLKVQTAVELGDNADLVAASDDTQVESERVEKNHGLWDNGIGDLNCDVTPFGVCMYTRASMFAGIVLVAVALVFTVISTAIVASGGNIGTGGTLARSSAIFTTLSAIGVFLGVLVFTIQHTSCISSCPPDFNYYPQYLDDVAFDWSFILAWVGLIFIIATSVMQFVFSCFAASIHKDAFSPNSPTSNPKGYDRPIELVRINEAAVTGGYTNTRKV